MSDVCVCGHYQTAHFQASGICLWVGIVCECDCEACQDCAGNGESCDCKNFEPQQEAK